MVNVKEEEGWLDKTEVLHTNQNGWHNRFHVSQWKAWMFPSAMVTECIYLTGSEKGYTSNENSNENLCQQ